MSKPIDNDTGDITLSNDSISAVLTDATLETLEVLQSGPPIKRMKLNDTSWTSTELTIQPETSDGDALTVNNTSSSSVFNINTSTPLTRSDAPVLIDCSNTEALLVRSDGDTGDILTVDTVTPLTRIDSSLLIDKSDTEALLVRADNDSGDIFVVDTVTPLTRIDSSLLIDKSDTEALLVRADNDSGDIFVVDTATPSVTSYAPVTIDNYSTSGFVVTQITPLFTVNTEDRTVTVDAFFNFTTTDYNQTDILSMSSGAFNFTVKLMNLNGWVFMSWENTTYNGSGNLQSVGTITGTYKPDGDRYFHCRISNNGTVEQRSLRLDSSGKLYIVNTSGSVAFTTQVIIYGGGACYKLT